MTIISVSCGTNAVEDGHRFAVSYADGTSLTDPEIESIVTLAESVGIVPSYLAHSVSPSESNEQRISVSFNLMFSSFAEKLSKPMWDAIGGR